MKSGRILNDQITASSVFNCPYCFAYCARLDQAEGYNGCYSGWISETFTKEWLKIDLLVEHNITGVVTQGRQKNGESQWVLLYSISYFKVNHIGETYITDSNNLIKIFDGNWDIKTERYHFIQPNIKATGIKFNIKGWNEHISLRVEILGCRTENNWVRAFKGISMNGLSIYNAWNSGTGSSNKYADKFLISNTHYRNNVVLNNWASLDVIKVKLTLYSAFNEELISILFNGVGTSTESWFTKANVESSPWDDMATASSNIFSIIGDERGRRFLMSSYYAGCGGDTGWFRVDETTSCREWEGYSTNPLIIYSRTNSKENWTTGNTGVARAMTIDVKLG
ncbi:coagulation factor V-like [Anneissia japonica]|uniref:coagulation factor V-like n=1 Tax=Anneissia japonica TaxID=1529436 RepID=UPI0014256F07|nr:coagulation factor V-like [Anneissia japonica]